MKSCWHSCCQSTTGVIIARGIIRLTPPPPPPSAGHPRLRRLLQDAFIPQDRESGRSRGFAFVTMSDSAAAQEAINKLHDTDFNVGDAWCGSAARAVY